MTDIDSRTVTISTDAENGRSFQGYLARPIASGRRTAVIVAHELFGMNPDIRGVTDGLARSGFVALAPEFYHRAAEPGRWWERDEAGRAEGFRMLDTLDRSNVVADVAAAMAYLRTDLSEAEGIDRISMLGFSVGGHIAYLAATQLDLAGTAVLYGGWLASTAIGLSRPEPTLSLTPGIAEHGGTILYLVGNEDAVISATDRAAIIEALTEAGVPHELVSYPDTAHAFFWEGADSFNAAARDDAWQRVLAFL